MNRPQPAFDACLAVLLLVLGVAITIVAVGVAGMLIVIAWRSVLVAALGMVSG